MKKLTTEDMLEAAYRCGQISQSYIYGEGAAGDLGCALGRAAMEIHCGLKSLHRGGKSNLLSGLEALRLAINAAPAQLECDGTLGCALSEVYHLEEILGVGHVGRTKRVHDMLAGNVTGASGACFPVAKAEYEASRTKAASPTTSSASAPTAARSA